MHVHNLSKTRRARRKGNLCHFVTDHKKAQNKVKDSAKKCKSGKIGFRNGKVATRELHRQQDWGAQVQRVYFCKICKMYHLTSISYSASVSKKEKKRKKELAKRKNNCIQYTTSDRTDDWFYPLEQALKHL